MAAGMTSSMSDSLARQVRRHLCDEEQSLVTVLAAVRQLHDSLRDLDGEALAAALQNESTALREAEGMQGRRHQIRHEAAGELGVSPQELTLGLLAANTSGDLQASIIESRRRLAEMSGEMDRLNRQNAAMIQQSMMLMRGIVGRLTGMVASGESYNAGGAREEAHVGSLVQWGG